MNAWTLTFPMRRLQALSNDVTAVSPSSRLLGSVLAAVKICSTGVPQSRRAVCPKSANIAVSFSVTLKLSNWTMHYNVSTRHSMKGSAKQLKSDVHLLQAPVCFFFERPLYYSATNACFQRSSSLSMWSLGPCSFSVVNKRWSVKT